MLLYPVLQPCRLMCLVLTVALPASAQTVHVVVDANQDRVAVSPYLYGKNGGLSHDAQQPLAEADWQLRRAPALRARRQQRDQVQLAGALKTGQVLTFNVFG